MGDFSIDDECLDDIELWHLTEEVSVVQATLLLLKLNPSNFHRLEGNAKRPIGYDAVSTALMNAILLDRLEARKIFHQNYDYQTLDKDETLINIADLKDWLKKRDFTNNFFFKSTIVSSEFTDQSNPFYAKKLSAAVKAWTAVTKNQELLEGKTPKQAIDK